MPWAVEGKKKSFRVVNQDSGKVMGHHPSAARARAQQRAIYANTDVGKYHQSKQDKREMRQHVGVGAAIGAPTFYMHHAGDQGDIAQARLESKMYGQGSPGNRPVPTKSARRKAFWRGARDAYKPKTMFGTKWGRIYAGTGAALGAGYGALSAAQTKNRRDADRATATFNRMYASAQAEKRAAKAKVIKAEAGVRTRKKARPFRTQERVAGTAAVGLGGLAYGLHRREKTIDRRLNAEDATRRAANSAAHLKNVRALDAQIGDLDRRIKIGREALARTEPVIPKVARHLKIVKYDRTNEVFTKSLYTRERSTSGVKVLEAGVGTGLAAWGLSRSPMLGAALARGLKHASGKDSRAAVEAIQLAQSAYGSAARMSGRGERAIRQIKRVDQAVSAVPAPMRPAVATTAGLLLLGDSRGMRRDSYHPVNIRIRTGYQGGF